MLIEVNVQDYFFTAADSTNVHKTEQIADEVWQNWFQQWLTSLEADIPAAESYELSLRLTNDAEMQILNAQYRHKNQPTDVLSFAALEVDCPQADDLWEFEPLYLGDIVISVDTAHRQAQQQGHSLKTELAWLAAHGLLHLLGWDHPDEDSLNRMLQQQGTFLKAIGLCIELT